MDFSTSALAGMLDDFAATLGADFTCKVFTGSKPANCAASDSGTLLLTLEDCNFSAASGGSMSLTGTPETGTYAASGSMGHFRFYNGSTCHAQGTVTASGGGGDLIASPGIAVSAGGPVSLTTFTLTLA